MIDDNTPSCAIQLAGMDYKFHYWEHDTEIGKVIRLEIFNIDETPIHSWDDMFKIKELLFPGRYAVEVFPPKDRLVDVKNHYHIWIMPEGYKMPFGLHQDDPAFIPPNGRKCK